jgi:hypothetical protein
MLEDWERVERILGQIGAEADRAWLVDRLSEPWQRRARRLAERDMRIREFALAYHPLMTGRGMAAAIAVELDRYRALGWRFEKDLPAPPDPQRGLLRRILHLNNGKSPSPGAVRAALAGVVIVGQKKPRKLATRAATPARFRVKLGTRRNVSGGAKVDRGQG